MQNKHLQILFILFLLLGCEKILTKSDNDNYDDGLITAIIEADKTNISVDELPSLSRSVINQEYKDFVEIDVRLAHEFGYQVSVDGKDYKPGNHKEVYFNLKGRKLVSKKRHYLNNSFKCFELVLPVFYLMPDGSSIQVVDENGYLEIKSWYNNHDYKERPQLKYPVNIIHKDGITEVIENEEMMRNFKQDCRDLHNDKNKLNCFNFVYPITFIMDDGSKISMNDSMDWKDIKTWHEKNPDLQRPKMQYPLEIYFKNGQKNIINTDIEMRNAYEDCKN